MTRAALGALTLAELASPSSRLVVFVDLQLDGGSERLHSWLGTIPWGGNDWVGVGELAEVHEIQESLDLTPDPLRLGLNGIDATITNIIDSEEIYRRPVLVYLGALNEDYDLVEDPGLIFSGFMQTLELTMGAPDGDAAVLTSESELLNFDRARNVRYTDNQLQSEYAGDVGLQYLEQVKDAKPVWRGTSQVRLGQGNPTASR